jgi:hypothetical protein
MTININPNKQPTAPGWWWGRNAWGEVNAILVWIEDGVIYDNRDPFKPETITDSECIEWLGPVLSHEEGQQLRHRIAELEARQARVMGAIDEARGKNDPCNWYDVGRKDACDYIRDKINEKAGTQ